MTIAELREKHPFPWTNMILPTGVVQVIDHAGGIVQLLDMVDFICVVTAHMTAQKEKV